MPGRLGSQVLHTTAHHPFWDQTARAWVLAGTLVTGHQLRTADGRSAVVTAVRNLAGPQTMRDLTIARTHTYYVIAGNVPVLVHNCGGRVDGPLPDKGQTSLYALHNPETGEILKWGTTKNPLTRYTCDCLERLGARMQIVQNFDSRADALTAERYMTERWPGPENYEPWAGSQTPTGTWQDGLKHILGGGLWDD
jgi:Pretoxin HINT domain